MTQSEWWTAHQSTLLPVIVYYRTKDGAVTWARSHVVMSPDPNHDNAFVQHVVDLLIKEYQEEFKKEGRALKHVHCWSDGCAGQVIKLPLLPTPPTTHPPFPLTLRVTLASSRTGTRCSTSSTIWTCA